MSLDPQWYSTMFGSTSCRAAALGFIAVWILICLAFRSAGILTQRDQRSNTTTISASGCSALTVLLGLHRFSQYMLIWYGNLPEETIWFRIRLVGFGSWCSLLLVFGHFIVPFLLLLLRAAKRNLKVLAFCASGCWSWSYFDLYWQVMPELPQAGSRSTGWTWPASSPVGHFRVVLLVAAA